MDSLSEPNFYISLAVSILVALYFIGKQRKFNKITLHNLELYRNFFAKNSKYDIYHKGEPKGANADGTLIYEANSARIKNVAKSTAALHLLINDINEYLDSCKGTATFEIIQNKVERRIMKMYENTDSKSSFPTHYGLMGTFIGVFIGLGMFLFISIQEGEITDSAIHSLIMGVLVSMSTSFIGLRMSTKANDKISNARTQIDEDKNEFYEFIQNKLMTSVNTSLTEALSSLHKTVTEFEPSFTTVINGFRETFQQCTEAFGSDFRVSVREMVGAVSTMSSNIGSINSNVELLQQLLNRLSSSEWTGYMREFANANDEFKKLTNSLNDFERARRMMLAATQEAINIQKTYNESLQLPRDVAMGINAIMQRVVRFEQNVNALGEEFAQIHMIGNTEIEALREQINAIKSKHRVAQDYSDRANEKLERLFEFQIAEITRMEGIYMDAIRDLYARYEEMTGDHVEEIQRRHEIFKTAIDEKFELSGVRSELSKLNRIPEIERKVDKVKTGQEELKKTNDAIREEINASNIILEDKEKGGFFGSGTNKARERELQAEKDRNKELTERLQEEQRKEVEYQLWLQQQRQHPVLHSKTQVSSTSQQNVEKKLSDTPKVQGPTPESSVNNDVHLDTEQENVERKGFFGRFFRRKK